MVNMRTIHGYRYQRADREELDHIRLHGFIVQNFTASKRKRVLQICQERVKYVFSNALFEKLGIVHYMNQDLYPQSTKKYLDEHEYTISMLRKRMEMVQEIKHPVQGISQGRAQTPVYKIKVHKPQNQESESEQSESASESFDINNRSSGSSSSTSTIVLENVEADFRGRDGKNNIDSKTVG